MPALASLLSSREAEQFAAVRAEAAERERQAAEAVTPSPVSATCQACGQARPVPAAVFRSAQ
jgi:hypothetical protein